MGAAEVPLAMPLAGLADAVDSFPSPPRTPDPRPVAARRFDFLWGSWTVRNRTLVDRLADSQEWREWDATLDVIPILGGMGSVDRFRAERDGASYEGVTVRLFDPTTERWSMYWMDDRGLRLTPQVGGPMEDWGGEFHGAEEFRGDTVALRFRWTHPTAGTARWEQAYQRADGTWEVNWTMEFTRPRGG
ncbi:MAG: hypothetical protein R3E10_06580 [Gemmatimonadota bacterium]